MWTGWASSLLIESENEMWTKVVFWGIMFKNKKIEFQILKKEQRGRKTYLLCLSKKNVLEESFRRKDKIEVKAREKCLRTFENVELVKKFGIIMVWNMKG